MGGRGRTRLRVIGSAGRNWSSERRGRTSLRCGWCRGRRGRAFAGIGRPTRRSRSWRTGRASCGYGGRWHLGRPRQGSVHLCEEGGHVHSWGTRRRLRQRRSLVPRTSGDHIGRREDRGWRGKWHGWSAPGLAGACFSIILGFIFGPFVLILPCGRARRGRTGGPVAPKVSWLLPA